MSASLKDQYLLCQTVVLLNEHTSFVHLVRVTQEPKVAAARGPRPTAAHLSPMVGEVVDSRALGKVEGDGAARRWHTTRRDDDGVGGLRGRQLAVVRHEEAGDGIGALGRPIIRGKSAA